MPIGTGLRLVIGRVRLKDGRIAVAGGGKLNDVFHTGADGGGRPGRRGVIAE